MEQNTRNMNTHGYKHAGETLPTCGLELKCVCVNNIYTFKTIEIQYLCSKKKKKVFIPSSLRSSRPSSWQTWRGCGTTPTRTRAAETAAARTGGTTTRSATAPNPRGRAAVAAAAAVAPTPGRGRTPPSATAKTTETTTARRPGTARTGKLLQLQLS